ncbi:MAG TPA: hypothetical protein VKX96_09590 [Chloroflexota bacterium]|nr:hypothetical protein [Chloroflexota bacterium]
MRRTFLWIGVVAAVVGYLVWTVTDNTNMPSSQTVTVPSPTALMAPVASRRSTSAVIPVTPQAQATPAPSNLPPILLLNTGRVTRRQVISVSGFGFAPNEKIRVEHVIGDNQLQTLATTKTDKDGNFAGATFRIADSWPSGGQTVEVIGLTSGRRARARFVLEDGLPGAAPTTYSGKPFSQVSFKGAGFHPNEPITVYFDSLDTTPITHLRADTSGNVQVKNVTVPATSPGDHAFLIVGQTSQAPVRVPFSVLAFNPWLGLTNYTPQPETTVGVTGHDFAPGERVAIFLDSPTGLPIAEAVVDQHNEFNLASAFAVPWNRRGKLKVYAVGTISQVVADTTLTVLPYTPTFGLTTYAGPPGTVVGLTGQGFAHLEHLTIELNVNNRLVAFNIQTDPSGRIAGMPTIRIPDRAPAGKLPVTAIGEHSQVPASVTFAVLPLNPWISPVPAAGPPGIQIALAGGGFEPGEKVLVSIVGDNGNAEPSITLAVNQTGAIPRSGALPIPPNATGKVEIQAVGASSGARATVNYQVLGAS